MSQLNVIFEHPLIYQEVVAQFKAKNNQSAYEFVSGRSRSGDQKYQVVQAICLRNGIGCNHDEVQSQKLLSGSKDWQATDALALLGEAYYLGNLGLAPDLSKSLFERLISLSPIKGNYMMAKFLIAESAKQDRSASKAMLYFKRAALGGHMISLYIYSSMKNLSALQKLNMRFRIFGLFFSGSAPSPQIRLWRHRDLATFSPTLCKKYDDYLCRIQARDDQVQDRLSRPDRF